MDSIAVGLVTIDNYDEVIDPMEDIQAALLLAHIDRHLNAMAQKAGGILKKFEKDRYLCILTQESLEPIKESGFDILRQVREMEQGNKSPVTLSIGVGVNGGNPAKSMEYARAAIDLALGRGGDQALIKDDEQYLFFGGNSRDVVDNTRVRTRVKAGAFSDLINESSNVVVMGHKNPDLDCIGAALGVYKIAAALGTRCNILLNSVSASIELLYKRLEGNYDGVFVTTAEALKQINEKSLLVIVDTHRPGLVESRELLEAGCRAVVFDHHRKSTEYVNDPVLVYHEPYASSASELITEMIRYLRSIELARVEADALLAGIMVDTKNFSVKTGAKTLEAAAFLHRRGADSLRVKKLLRFDMAFYKARTAIVNNAEIIGGKFAVSVCPPGTRDAALTAAQSADELLGIYGIEAAYVLCAEGERVKISARSLGGVNVQRVMEMLGGGGHQMIAGAQLSCDIADACARLKIILQEGMNL